jgi:hypothetical protein
MQRQTVQRNQNTGYKVWADMFERKLRYVQGNPTVLLPCHCTLHKFFDVEYDLNQLDSLDGVRWVLGRCQVGVACCSTCQMPHMPSGC